MRKTKILATLGPATYSDEAMSELIRAGADAFRFNFSHGTHDQHSEAFRRARTLSSEAGKTMALIQDLQGPRIRVGELESKVVELFKDQHVTLTSKATVGAEGTVPIRYDKLEQEVDEGHIILINDGKVRLEVLRKDEDGAVCRVIEGGPVEPHKGVNFPDTLLSTPALTGKDKEDLRFGLELDFDAVALSFVSEAADVLLLKDEMTRLGKVKPIISKLERAACIDHLDEILEVSDAVMVARGDLGIEVDIKRLPILQKTIITKANSLGVPVITATQMLESMTKGLLPTRAEVADVANAVLDGADVLMLSGETAVGAYPAQTVEMMHELAVEAEAYSHEAEQELWKFRLLRREDIAEAVCHTAVVAAHDLGLDNIVAVTLSGQTALDIAKFRPHATIHAFAQDWSLTNFLALSRGVRPNFCSLGDDLKSVLTTVDAQLTEHGISVKGDVVALVLGFPIKEHEGTNALLLHKLGST